MQIKDTVGIILKKKSRTFAWLAIEMKKTFDGLKLSLINESIKYKDILTMSKVLEVHPSVFFDPDETVVEQQPVQTVVKTPPASDAELRACKELVVVLKDQLKDKETIISLLKNKDS